MMARVLVVEDEVSIQVLVCNLLKRKGFEVAVTSTGEGALLYLHEGKVFDMVLTDIQLPGMDGVALIEFIKRAYPATLVIAMSAYPDRLEEAVQRGADSYLKKPFSYEEFMATLGATLARVATYAFTPQVIVAEAEEKRAALPRP
jgi:CheY-like chemotaxis protein